MFEALIGGLNADFANRASEPERRALAVATLCVCGMVIARAGGEDPLASDEREAARQFAMELGGWDKPDLSY